MFCVRKDKVVQAIKRHITNKIIKLNNPSWLNNEVQEAIAYMEGLYKVLINNAYQESQHPHKQAGISVNKVVRNANRNKEINVARTTKHNPKRSMHM